MTAKFNNGAGGTNGTTVTPANSGGASGTAWDAASPGTGATLIYDNTHIWDSPFAYEIATGSTSTTNVLTWNTSFNDDEVWGSFYAYFTTFTGMTTSTAAVRLRGGASVQAARLSWTATGQIRISDTSTSNSVTMTTACPANAWFRIDYHVKVSTGVSDVWLYANNPDAPTTVTADDHISASGALYGANNINEFGFGVVANNANIGPYWFANIGVSNVGVPGPPIIWSSAMGTVRRRIRRILRPWWRGQRSVRTAAAALGQTVPARGMTSRRMPMRPFRGHVASPPPATVVATPPVKTPPTRRQRLVNALATRKRISQPPGPITVAPQPSSLVPFLPPRRKPLLGRLHGRAASPPAPTPAVPSYPQNPPRLPFTRLRSRASAPVPPSAVPPPWISQKAFRTPISWWRPRPKASTPVITQYPLQPSVYQTMPLRRTRLMFPRFSGRARTPVPPQVVPPPPFTPQDVRRAKLFTGFTHGRNVTSPPAEAAALPPRFQPAAIRRLRFNLGILRGHRATPTPLQALPPVQSVHRTRFAFIQRRGRAGTPVPLQDRVPVSTSRPRRQLLFGRLRGKATPAVPPQVPPPVQVIPQRARNRIGFTFWLRRRNENVMTPPAPLVQRQVRRVTRPPLWAIWRRRQIVSPQTPIVPRDVQRHGTPLPMARRGKIAHTPPPQTAIVPSGRIANPQQRWRRLTVGVRHWFGLPPWGQAVPMAPRIHVAQFGELESKWSFANNFQSTPVMFGAPFDFAEAESKWVIGEGVLMLAIPAESLEYIRIPVFATTGGQPVNPTANTVQMAFLTSSTVAPGVSDWVAASWDIAANPLVTFVAQCLVGPGGTTTLAIGTYYVWVKVVATPETIVRQIRGTLQITV